jgi:hypothetical protein
MVGGQGGGAKEEMAKEKCKALEAKSAGTQHWSSSKFIRAGVVVRRQSTMTRR